jgi:hypothetical protein
LLAPITVNQYNKQRVAKRKDINSRKERRCWEGWIETTSTSHGRTYCRRQTPWGVKGGENGEWRSQRRYVYFLPVSLSLSRRSPEVRTYLGWIRWWAGRFVLQTTLKTLCLFSNRRFGA